MRFSGSTGLLLLVAIAMPITAQQRDRACPLPRSTAATIGVGSYACYGGNCILFDTSASGRSHTFTVEPLLRGVPDSGPAAGLLFDGDVIVSVNGALITTARAGLTLAQPEAGRPIRFRVRRSGQVIETEVTPVEGCEQVGIVISASPESEAAARKRLATFLSRGNVAPPALRPAAPNEIPIDFGMTLTCSDCGWLVAADGSGLQWHSLEAPRVADVEVGGPAFVAGVRTGDVLRSIGGAPLVGSSASPVWATLRPRQQVTLRLSRNGRELQLTIAPRATRLRPF